MDQQPVRSVRSLPAQLLNSQKPPSIPIQSFCSILLPREPKTKSPKVKTLQSCRAPRSLKTLRATHAFRHQFAGPPFARSGDPGPPPRAGNHPQESPRGSTREQRASSFYGLQRLTKVSELFACHTTLLDREQRTELRASQDAECGSRSSKEKQLWRGRGTSVCTACNQGGRGGNLERTVAIAE